MTVAGSTPQTLESSGVTISVPRARYAEVRDLHPSDRVRVRGYLSKFWAEGCDWHMINADRFLWGDTIERIAPATSAATP
jgi:hypothetical protein